jgi:glutathione S-transferase
MKLYYSPGACSFAPHIAAIEAGVPVTPVKVDLRSHKLADGTDYYTINPKGYVPLLELDDGTRMAEAAVILQYIADRKPGTLAPAFGTLERYRLMEWLNFIATELHKGFSPLWHQPSDEVRAGIVDKLGKRFDIVAAALAKSEFVAGPTFTIADAYLYTILSWSKFLKVDLSRWPSLVAYLERIGARPAVLEAKRVESGPAKQAA